MPGDLVTRASRHVRTCYCCRWGEREDDDCFGAAVVVLVAQAAVAVRNVRPLQERRRWDGSIGLTEAAILVAVPKLGRVAGGEVGVALAAGCKGAPHIVHRLAGQPTRVAKAPLRLRFVGRRSPAERQRRQCWWC